MKIFRTMAITMVVIAPMIAFSQTDPQGTPPGTNTSARAAAAWYRGGNNFGNTIPRGANIFGTMWNSPIYTYTNGVSTMKLNGDISYPISGHGGNRNGFMLLGNRSQWSQNIFNVPNFGAFSLLHLNGDEGTFVQTVGYRDWMRTGITFTDNNDLSYIGLRKVGNGTDKTETTIAWSDNPGNGAGPDVLSFRFTSGSGSADISDDLTLATDLDGLHIARFTGQGLMGLGPTFGIDNMNYVSPASLLHMSRVGNEQTWLQITNQNGTEQTVDDGLRIGIRPNRTAYIRQQENRPLIIQTDWNNGSGGINNGERMRITSIGAPSVPDPAGATNNNITRVALSHQGNDPITQPRSLLHLGYNTGGVGGSSTDGWRNWMDIGSFTSDGKDNTFIGLKAEGSSKADAIINWGDNVGQNDLRFIFTSNTNSSTAPANSSNGLEVARFVPQLATPLSAPNYGMMGIGDFTVAAPIDAKLDIDGDLRIRTISQNNELSKILVADPDDLNRVHWRDAATLGGGGTGITQANNGLSINPSNSNQVQLGQAYTNGTVLNGGELLNAREIPMNGKRLLFAGNGRIGFRGMFDSKVSIQNDDNWQHILLMKDSKGNDALRFTEGRKLTINAEKTQTSGQNAIEISSKISGTSSPGSAYSGFNLRTETEDTSSLYSGANISMVGISNSLISGLIVNATPASGVIGIGDYIGIQGTAARSTSGKKTGVFGHSSNPGLQNIGVEGNANGADFNIGVRGSSNGPNSYAGWFQGNVMITGSHITASDNQFKTNQLPLTEAISIINQLSPKSYNLDSPNYSYLGFDSKQHLGLIAQEVEKVLPDLVSDIVMVAEYDTLGKQTQAQLNYKGLNYQEFIPLLIAGMQEQQVALTDKDALIDNLNERLTQLENCLSNILPLLCKVNNNGVNKNNPSQQEELRSVLNVHLNNGEMIVLEQNVPNPFAEQTTIDYELPTTVQKAQILFYNLNGQLIQTVNLDSRGKGSLIVFGSDLSSGMYTYSLIADGQLIATKKMLKTH
ncbi:tail fiber domain-containing protein [Ulvibacter antarcticus]|uniref:Putative secreted protein (Por secretion system target) n=1 Tax=Ulvibacter antarcticus TaxID=442714 RepID=A0A3L9Z193_9FLAO|nr:tail fiber domain-containing protein [Ulvibacter antarcticus]RMA65880.1 putative secreted protein (Por secretion system target) [Ulvibacter antarcticus]